MTRIGLLLILLAQVLLATAAAAHEMRPAYLDLRETVADEFSVLWKVPALGDMRLGLYVRLPGICKPKAESTKAIEENAYLERWTAICTEGLKGREITIDGLRATMTDASGADRISRRVR